MGCAEREAADGVSGEGRLTLSIRMRLDSLCANHLVRDHSERTDTALGPHLGPWRLLGTEARKAAPTLPATGDSAELAGRSPVGGCFGSCWLHVINNSGVTIGDRWEPGGKGTPARGNGVGRTKEPSASLWHQAHASIPARKAVTAHQGDPRCPPPIVRAQRWAPAGWVAASAAGCGNGIPATG